MAPASPAPTPVLDFSEISLRELARVGGRNSSIGELFGAFRPKAVAETFLSVAAAESRDRTATSG